MINSRPTYVVIIASALLLAGCGSSSKRPSSTTTTTAAPTTTAGITRCYSSQLKVSTPAPRQSVAAQPSQAVVLTNTSETTCNLYGYPGVQLLGSSGQPLPTTVKRGRSMLAPDPGPSLVQLSPGSSASFALSWDDSQTQNSSGSLVACSNTSSIEITPPNDYHYLTIPYSLHACGNGSLTVSAVVAGPNGPASHG